MTVCQTIIELYYKLAHVSDINKSVLFICQICHDIHIIIFLLNTLWTWGWITGHTATGRFHVSLKLGVLRPLKPTFGPLNRWMRRRQLLTLSNHAALLVPMLIQLMFVSERMGHFQKLYYVNNAVVQLRSAVETWNWQFHGNVEIRIFLRAPSNSTSIVLTFFAAFLWCFSEAGAAGRNMIIASKSLH